jgi:hypothetical protein
MSLHTTNLSANAQRAQTPTQVRSRPRQLYLSLATLFAGGVLVQVFLAGAGIFSDGAWLGLHGMFAIVLYLLSIGLVILSFVARLPRAVKAQSGLLVLLIMSQWFWLYGVSDLGFPLLKAIHPVNALLIFGLPLWQIAQVRRLERPAA